jgi:hypothetical protein
MLAATINRDSSGQDEQLLRLYWNRAAVKKELAGLRKERHELLDRLKQQEGAVVRSQEQLEALERLLTNPLAAANAMVYFQLRHLWRVASQRLQQFAAELRLQQEKRERDQLHGKILAKRDRRLKAIEEKIASLTVERADMLGELKELEGSWDRSNVVVQLLGRRNMRKQREALNISLVEQRQQLEEIEYLKDKIAHEALPESSGLSIDTRRAINRALIALAQHLVVHFSDHNLASLAKAAINKPVTDMKFGDRRDCDRMVEKIRECLEALTSQKDLAGQVKARAAMIGPKLRYRNDSDSVPVPDGVADIAMYVATSDAPTRRDSDAPIRVNVLEQEYWDIYSVLA